MSAIGNFGKRSIRSVKNYAKGYSATQAKVRNATSNDPWPATQKQLEEISQLSYRVDDFDEIIEILEKRLNDNGKNWRHVQKVTTLVLIEHLLQNGPERMVHYCKNHFHTIRTLREFQFTDERGNDYGANVRQKARDVSNLLTNPSNLRHKRRARSMTDTNLLLSLADTAEVDDEENENIRRRDLALVRASLPARLEGAPATSEERQSRKPIHGQTRPLTSIILENDYGGVSQESPSPSPLQTPTSARQITAFNPETRTHLPHSAPADSILGFDDPLWSHHPDLIGSPSLYQPRSLSLDVRSAGDSRSLNPFLSFDDEGSRPKLSPLASSPHPPSSYARASRNKRHEVGRTSLQSNNPFLKFL